MRHDLKPHPSTFQSPVEAIRIGVERIGPALSLTYALAGDVERIRTGDGRPPQRSEGLWRHTCFEAFLRAPGEEAYLEFNFSPSGEWAAYRFEGYRVGRTDLDLPAPSIGGHEGSDLLVRWISLEGLPGNRNWQFGFSAVIEDIEGRLSYWALAHPPGDPDFHHPSCFAAELTGPPDPSPRT